MKKFSTFKVLLHYLKDDKLTLCIYIFLVLITYLPSLLAAFFWGFALERLIEKDIYGFVMYLGLWEGLFILFYTILLIPRDSLYK